MSAFSTACQKLIKHASMLLQIQVKDVFSVQVLKSAVFSGTMLQLDGLHIFSTLFRFVVS